MKIETTMECVEARLYGNWARVTLNASTSSEYEVLPEQSAAIICLPQNARQMLGRTFRVTVEAIGDDA